jgi:hypothetical protein
MEPLIEEKRKQAAQDRMMNAADTERLYMRISTF